MKKTFVLVLLLSVCFLVCGCVPYSTSVQTDRSATNDQMNTYQQTQPMHKYSYSPERDRFIQLYDYRMKSVSTFTVVTTNMGGVPVWSCPSSGYPIPADVQLTNPLQTMNGYAEGSVVEQAEPNGLYSSKNTVGTWVFCVTQRGEVTPVYTELNATAFPFVVGYNPKTGMLERVDDKAVEITIVDKKE